MEPLPVEVTLQDAAVVVPADHDAPARRRSKALVLPVVLLTIVVVAAFIGPLLVTDPNAQDLRAGDRPPFGFDGAVPGHPLGTDAIGRDILSRTLHGLQASIETSFLALVIAAMLGILVGLVAGYRGGWIDDVVMRIVDIQLAIPTIMLLLLVVSIVEPSFTTVVLVLALLAWIVYVRTARAEVMALRQQEMVTALVGLGVPTRRVLVHHLLPNIAGPLIVVTTIEFASLITAGAALSYLGLGLPPPAPTLGGMIEDGQTGMTAGLWWPVVVPAVVLAFVILTISVLSERLRQHLDPRARSTFTPSRRARR